MTVTAHHGVRLALAATMLLAWQSHAAAAAGRDPAACAVRAIDEVDAANRDLRLVDTRRLVLPSDPKIPQALPLASLTRTAQGDSKPVLLIGTGLGSSDDRAACALLQASGYDDVSILRGGLRSWARAGRPLWGGGANDEFIDRISAANALWAAAQEDVHVFVLDANATSGSCIDHPAVRCFASMRELRRELARCGSDATVAVAADDRAWTDLRRAAQRSKRAPDLIRITGDASALRAQVEQQHAMAAATEHTLWMSCQTH